MQLAREAAVLSFRAERGHFKSVYMQAIFTVMFLKRAVSLKISDVKGNAVLKLKKKTIKWLTHYK